MTSISFGNTLYFKAYYKPEIERTEYPAGETPPEYMPNDSTIPALQEIEIPVDKSPTHIPFNIPDDFYKPTVPAKKDKDKRVLH